MTYDDRTDPGVRHARAVDRPPIGLADVASAVTIVAALIAAVAWFTADRFTRSDFDAWTHGDYQVDQTRQDAHAEDVEARLRVLERRAP